MVEFRIYKNWLKRVSFLTDEDCNLFIPHLELKTFAAKEHYLQTGFTCKTIGFVNKGLFRTYYLQDGKEINTHFVFEEEFVTDYASFLQNEPSKYSIQALETSEIVTFNLEALQKAYTLSHNWERFGRMMAEESFRITNKRVESFLFCTGEERYVNLIKSNSRLLERVPLYHIASYLGMERESLSRLRRKIARKNRL